MNENNVYLNEPKIAVAESAWDKFKLLQGDFDSEKQTVKYIAMLHDAHVRKMLAADQLSGDGAVIMTDIPGYDLVLVDANFPSRNERQTTLFSRAGAEFVVGILARRGHSVSLVQ